MFLVLLAVPALAAARLEWLAPRAAPAEAPFDVALVQSDGAHAPAQVTVRAQGGALSAERTEGVLRRYTVTPMPGAREVALDAEEGANHATAQVALGPPSERVALSLNPAQPVKGRDSSATLTVQLRTASGAPDAAAPFPVLRANVGTIDQVERVGPGSFRARYVLPTTRYPEVVVLVAFSAWPSPASVEGAAGSLVVPLATSLPLPGRTEPGAQMSLEIAGQHFGPVRADSAGKFELPVVVPPGHRFAKGLVVDRIGNRRVEQIDLALPPTDPLSCVLTPRKIPLGTGTARVLCATTDPYGHPLDAADVSLKAERGTLSGPHRAGQGLLEWRYRAPKTPAGKLAGAAADAVFAPDRLEARWRKGGPLAKESFEIAFLQGPAARVRVSSAEPVVFRGGSVPIRVEVNDALGLPCANAQVDGRADDGAIRPWTSSAPGVFETRYAPAPTGEAGRATLQIAASGPEGSDPAALHAWLDGRSLRIAVVDAVGRAIPAQPLLFDGKQLETDAHGIATLVPNAGAHLLSHRLWPALQQPLWLLAGGTQLFPASTPIRPVESGLAIEIAPPVPVNVRVQVHGREVRYWAEDPDGHVLANRALEVWLSQGSPQDPSESEGVHRFGVEGTGPVSVSVADRDSGISAIAEVGR